jgi:hypothetical protein
VISVRARCTCGPNERFQSTVIQRRDPGPCGGVRYRFVIDATTMAEA